MKRLNLPALVLFVLLLAATGTAFKMYFSWHETHRALSELKRENDSNRAFIDCLTLIHLLIASGKTTEAKATLMRQQKCVNDSVFAASIKMFEQFSGKKIFLPETPPVQKIAIMQPEHTSPTSPCDELEGKYASVCKLADSLSARLSSSKKPKEFLSIKGLNGKPVYYVGDVEDGKANGKGIGIWASGSVYEGDWENNKRHGYGIYKWVDGERYEGEYRDDHRHGTGTYYWKTGQRYEGGWENDMREGSGVIYEVNGKEKLRGIWKKDNYQSIKAK